MANKFYTKENIDFIRKNYENTLLTMHDVCKIFNKKFKSNISYHALSNQARKRGIKKNSEMRYKMQLEAMKKMRVMKKKGPTKWTREIISFIRKCSREGLTSKEAGEKANIHFGGAISLSKARAIGYRYKINFVLPSLNHEPEILSTEKFQKFMAFKKNQGLKTYELQSNIIEKFGINLNYNVLINYCRRKGIKYL